MISVKINPHMSLIRKSRVLQTSLELKLSSILNDLLNDIKATITLDECIKLIKTWTFDTLDNELLLIVYKHQVRHAGRTLTIFL